MQIWRPWAIARILLACAWLALAGQVLAAEADLRIMSFNVWGSDESSDAELAKLGNAMIASGANIIGLQELLPSRLDALAAQLTAATGKPWYSSSMSSFDVQILSSYPILKQAPAVPRPPGKDKEFLPTVWGAQFELSPGHNAWLFNAHFTPDPYQPYLLRDGSLAQNETAVVNSASLTRGPDVNALLSGITASGAIAAGEPAFITGDFNEPSHLDWTQAAANATARTYDLKVAWPESSAIAQAGFQDSFRTIHPDPVTKPGYTWTPGRPSNNSNTTPPKLSANEVHDRIDFIYYQGPQITPTNSNTLGYPDNDPNTDVAVPGYNSDHRAVVSDFKIGGLKGSKLTFSKLGPNGSLVNQNYGDRLITSPEIAVSYSTPAGPGQWKFWEEGNWNSGGAAFLDSGDGGQANGSAKYELTLTPDSGFGVLLTGFDLIDFADTGDAQGHVVHWTLKGPATDLSGTAVVPDDGTLHVNVPMTLPSTGALILALQHVSGIDNYLALDNVAFAQAKIVAEPTASSTCMIGAAALGAVTIARVQIGKRNSAHREKRRN